MTPPSSRSMQEYSALPGCTSFGDVVGEQPAQVVAHPLAAQVHDAHVRDVEHAGVAAHRVVLLDLRAVVDGHVPAAEVHHAGAGGGVDVMERRSQSHRLFPGSRAIKKAAGLSGLPPLCPVT